MKTILIFLCLLIIASTTFASQRGIKITTTTGKDISLYTDYYALVIGSSSSCFQVALFLFPLPLPLVPNPPAGGWEHNCRKNFIFNR